MQFFGCLGKSSANKQQASRCKRNYFFHQGKDKKRDAITASLPFKYKALTKY